MHIKELNALPEIARHADFSFEISEIILPPFDVPPLVAQPTDRPFTKNYGIDTALFEPVDTQQRAVFAAYEEQNLAGYIVVSRDWNECALIEDIAVARPFRRRRVAGSLLDAAVAWSRAIGLGTIRLETQSTNSAACRLYQNYGFVLGGYDRFLYREIDPQEHDEAALFWYLFLR